MGSSCSCIASVQSGGETERHERAWIQEMERSAFTRVNRTVRVRGSAGGNTGPPRRSTPGKSIHRRRAPSPVQCLHENRLWYAE